MYLTSNKEQTTDNRGQAYVIPCTDGELHEAYFRGNKGYYRKYQMSNARGTQIPQFQELVNLNTNPTALPGSGEITAQNSFLYTDGGLQQSIYRGGKFYFRGIEVENYKDIKFSKAGEWKESVLTDDFPSGNIDAFSQYRLSFKKQDGMLSYNQFFIENKGFLKSTKTSYINGEWKAETIHPFSVVLDLNTNSNALPGSGKVHAIANYPSLDDKKVYQTFFRGNIGYKRTVPVLEGIPQYTQATTFTKFVDLVTKPNAWPGTGTIQTYDAYILCK